LKSHSRHPQELAPATRRAIVLLSLATFSSMALQRICDPMLPELSRVFDAPIDAVSQVISWFAITYGLMQLFYGPFGDRFGKYRVVMWATFGCGLSCLLSAFCSRLDALIAARVASAASAAAIIPLSLAWVGDAVKYQQRQETLARVGLGTMLGISAGQLFGGLLTDTLGWRWAFVLIASVFACVSFLLWQQLNQVEASSHANPDSTSFFKQLIKVARDRWARTLLCIALMEGAMIFGLLAVTASHLHHTHQISLTLAGGTTALFGLGGMAYMGAAKFVIHRYGEVGLARAGGLYFGLAFLLVAFSPWWQVALPACFIAGFGFAMFHNTMQAKATQMVPTARGTGVTLFAGFLFLGQSLGVLLLAALISRFDSRFVLGGVGVCVVALGIFFADAITQRNATHADHA
jgi:predicted MFS family arabinose efflux permease